MPENVICQVCLKYFDSLEVIDLWGITYCRGCQDKWEKEKTTFDKARFKKNIDKNIKRHTHEIVVLTQQRNCRHKEWSSPYDNYGKVKCLKCGVDIDGGI
jgi:hypothetical protein